MSDDKVTFDPTETIETKKDVETAAGVIEADKKLNFSAIPVESFESFDINDVIPNSGDYLFEVSPEFLKDACATIKAAVPTSSTSFNNVKITLLEGMVRLASFSPISLAEKFIPSVSQSGNDLASETVTSILFDIDILLDIATKFMDEDTIKFEFQSEKSLLKILSGSTDLELTTAPATDFVEYRTKIGANMESKGNINIELFKKSLKYIQLFIKKDDEIQKSFTVVEFRDGMLVGGSLQAVGIYNSEHIPQGLGMAIKTEAIEPMIKTISKFDPNNTQLFESESFYILKDATLLMAVSKTANKFPSVKRFLEANTAGDETIIPRLALLQSLQKLSIVSKSKDLPVLIKIMGKHKEAEVHLSILDASGKISSDKLEVFRDIEEGQDNTENVFAEQEYRLNMNMLIKLVKYFDVPNVVFKGVPGTAIMVENSEEGQFLTTTILSVDRSTEKVKTDE